jgi:hypothetical protein
MSEDTLAETRSRRDAAWARIRGNVTALRTGFAEKPISTRMRERAVDKALDTVDEVKAMARGNIPVIAGTGALLAAWLLRRPLFRLFKNRFAPSREADEDVT